MTDTQILMAVLGLIGFAGMIYIPLILLVVRMQQTLNRVTAGSHRETDRERRDLQDMMMRMIESQGVGPTLAMQQHATERMERMRLETSLQRDEVKIPVHTGVPPQGLSPDGEPTDDVIFGLE